MPAALDMLFALLHYVNREKQDRTLTGTAFQQNHTTMPNLIYRLFYYAISLRPQGKIIVPKRNQDFFSILNFNELCILSLLTAELQPYSGRIKKISGTGPGFELVYEFP